MGSPNPPAQQAGIPLNQGVIDPPGDFGGTYTFAQPWFYLFQQLWQKLGGQYSKPQSMVFGLQTSSGPAVVTFYSVTTGEEVGHVVLTPPA